MGKHGVPKEFKRLIDAALEAGWTISVARGQAHKRLDPPGGGKPVIVSASPRDPHVAFLEVRAKLRRAGLSV
jgi:hypothetical protein